jgi:hypothetical protein
MGGEGGGTELLREKEKKKKKKTTPQHLSIAVLTQSRQVSSLKNTKLSSFPHSHNFFHSLGKGTNTWVNSM